jgi:protein TonB
MIAKKSPKADLEKKRFAFFQIGLIIAGSACLAAFEYTTVQMEEPQYVYEDNREVIDVIPELPEDPIQKPQKTQKVTAMSEEINVVKNEVIEGDPVKVDKYQKIVIEEGEGDDCIGCDYTYVDLEPDEILPVSEVEPEFPGGPAAMAGFIQKNINLPDNLSVLDQGTVYVEFVVNKDGSIEQANVVGKVSPDVDKAALNVVRNMPNWKPGEQAGKTVRVRYTVPIKVILE